MRFKINGKQCLLDGRFAETRGGALSFQVAGSHFPYSNYEPPDSNTIAFNSTFFSFSSSVANKATINYADGSIITYDFKQFGGAYVLRFYTSIPLGDSINSPIYTYADGNADKRVIQISFAKPDAITEITTQNTNIYGVFPSSIIELSSLAKINLSRTQITQFPVSLSGLKSLTIMTLLRIGYAISIRIPSEFLSLNLSYLDVSGSVDMSNLETSNFISLCNSDLKYILNTLIISGCELSTLPADVANLIALRTLNISYNLFDTVPASVNSITSLTFLQVGSGLGVNSTIKFWSSISNLVNLVTLNCAIAQNMETNLPQGMGNCVLLKTFNVSATYNTTARIDAFINNMYDFVVANAAIFGANTLKFRGMTVSNVQSGSTSGVPSGTYQQPAGFALGISNGTPASPREKIWVMVNQYGHTWTYATS